MYHPAHAIKLNGRVSHWTQLAVGDVGLKPLHWEDSGVDLLTCGHLDISVLSGLEYAHSDARKGPHVRWNTFKLTSAQHLCVV